MTQPMQSRRQLQRRTATRNPRSGSRLSQTRDRFAALRWGLAGDIVRAWILTIPASALVAACAWVLERVLLVP
jgi:phosphate/sulfate permease